MKQEISRLPRIQFKGFYEAILLILLHINPPKTELRGFAPIGIVE
jgi:hypothetical protein